MKDGPVWPLLAVFVPLSLASVGGGTSILAGIQHEAVEVRHWVTPAEFLDLFGIARAAPGPGSMLATLIGWQIGGFLGALVATLALFVPSSILAYAVGHVWRRYSGRRWHTALQDGMVPIGTGLVIAGIISIFRISGSGPLSWGVAVGSAVLLGFRPNLAPPLVFLVAAGLFVAVQLAQG